MPTKCTITGTVVAPDGSPIALAQIEFGSARVRPMTPLTIAPESATATTDEAGALTVKLYPGEYSVRAMKTGRQRYPTFSITVPETATAELADIIDLPPPVSLDAAGQAVLAAQHLRDEAAEFASDAEAAEFEAGEASGQAIDAAGVALGAAGVATGKAGEAADSAAAALAAKNAVDLGALEAAKAQTEADRLAAAGSAAAAGTAAGTATGAATTAGTAKTAAEVARDAAIAAGVVVGTYASTAAGLAAVTEGVKFWAPSTDGLTLQQYTKTSGAAVAVTGNAIATQIGVIAAGARDFFRRADPQYGSRKRERERAIRAAAEARLVLSSKTIYCAPGATGIGDGSSWANAFTTMNTAFAAAADGDTILTDAPQSAPFPLQGVVLATPKQRLRIITNAGPSGVTWIDGRNRLLWTDAGSGIWSAALTTKPHSVAYDIKQDDVTGTVTGVDLTKADVAEAIAKAGRSPADLVAWYGYLREQAATTSPNEGYWSHIGGVLYINPPGTPVKADVDGKTAYSNGSHGLRISGALLSDSYIYGDLRTFFTASNAAGAGYGLRLENERRTTVADHYAYLCGYHATGITNGNALRGSAIVGCTTIGQANNVETNSGVFPFVFYSTNGTTGDADLLGQNLMAILFPQLDTLGAPILASGVGYRYTPALGFSHTAGSGAQLSGVEWLNIFQIDFLDELEKKHSVTINYQPSAPYGGNHRAVTLTEPSDWPIRCIDSYIVGAGAAPSIQSQYENCRFSRAGRGKTAQSILVMSDGSSPKQYRVRGGSINTGVCNRYFSNARLTDGITLEAVDITLEQTVDAFKQGQGCPFTMKGCTVQSDLATNAILEANSPTQYNAEPYAGYVSSGGNIFGPNVLGEKHPAYPSVAARTLAQLIAASDPKGRDAIGVDLR